MTPASGIGRQEFPDSVQYSAGVAAWLSAVAQTSGDLGVAAYKGQAGNLMGSKDVLTTATPFLA